MKDLKEELRALKKILEVLVGKMDMNHVVGLGLGLGQGSIKETNNESLKVVGSLDKGKMKLDLGLSQLGPT